MLFVWLVWSREIIDWSDEDKHTPYKIHSIPKGTEIYIRIGDYYGQVPLCAGSGELDQFLLFFGHYSVIAELVDE